MEGARIWDRRKVPGGDIARAVIEDAHTLKTHELEVSDPSPVAHPDRNPLQSSYHTFDEVEAIASHLKRSLELMVVDLFAYASRSKRSLPAEDIGKEAFQGLEQEPLKVRWVEAYFPFTSPSWELEVFWQGDWLEILGCGITKQEIHINAGMPYQVGWAFGVGLERLAMLLFSIPDIRLFWSADSRFLSQFSTVNDIKTFTPFSKYPACYKDVSFWLRGSTSAAGGGLKGKREIFHKNDLMEIVRNVGGDLVEDVKLIDEFTHPVSAKRSLCYRINYRSLERTLTNEEADAMHEEIRKQIVDHFGVEIR